MPAAIVAAHFHFAICAASFVEARAMASKVAKHSLRSRASAHAGAEAAGQCTPRQRSGAPRCCAACSVPNSVLEPPDLSQTGGTPAESLVAATPDAVPETADAVALDASSSSDESDSESCDTGTSSGTSVFLIEVSVTACACVVGSSLSDKSWHSEDSGVFHVAVDPRFAGQSREDRDLLRVRSIAAQLRAHGTEPSLPTTAFRDVGQDAELCRGALWPSQHCAFQGCVWVGRDDYALAKRLFREHITADERITCHRDALDFYIEAIAENARKDAVPEPRSAQSASIAARLRR